MTDALNRLIETIKANGFHSHRGQEHSDVLSDFILEDLTATCVAFRQDIESGVVRSFGIGKTPGARGRRADLLVAEPAEDNEKIPDLRRLRLCVENKSVVTAHRNATSRYDDLNEVVNVLHREQPEAIFVATVLIGIAPRYLNVNDGVKKVYKAGRMVEFETKVLPRLSTGDQSLWDEFPSAISPNKPKQPARSVELFRTLNQRSKAQTHKAGYDFILLVPVDINNVDPPKLAPPGTLGIDAVADYNMMIHNICEAYTVRFH